MSLAMQPSKVDSQKKIEELKYHLTEAFPMSNPLHRQLCVFACGSLGRYEMTQNSDLDLFFVLLDDRPEDISNLDKYLFFSKLYDISKRLGYEDPSKHGLYWDFISKENLLDIGSRLEDYNNSFTARMLLILESKVLYNEEAYDILLESTVQKYFVDFDGRIGQFYPLYLMNDIMRYWYTLTLNYEYARDEKDSENKKNWKRLKLKYARLITCFSMLACLFNSDISPEYVISCIKKTPFERLQAIVKIYPDLAQIVNNIEEEYDWFLYLRNNSSSDWWDFEDNKYIAMEHADKFHNLVVHEFMKLLSEKNPSLRNKTDVF